MANKRMFSLQVTETDKFLDMPTSAQALYFHLGMHGDDDGFVSSPRKICRSVGCNDDDMRLLAAKGYIIPFKSGIVVITDWKINNTLKNDRYNETIYKSEKAQLLSEKNGRYFLATPLEPGRNQSGSNVEPQHNITQHNVTEINGDVGENETSAPARRSYSQYGWVKLSQEEYNDLIAEMGEAEAKRCIAYVDESAQSNSNKNGWTDWALVVRRCHRDGWGKSQKADKKQVTWGATGEIGEEELYAIQKMMKGVNG